MGEFESRQNVEPIDVDVIDTEFQDSLLNETNPDVINNLIETKAQQILVELHEGNEIGENQVDPILNQYIPLEFDGDKLNPENILNISEVVYSQIINYESLSSEDYAPNTIRHTLNRINQALPKINENIHILDDSERLSSNPKVLAYKSRFLDYQRELLLLKEQLEYKLENNPFLQGNSIEESLDKFRLYKSKLNQLPENSAEKNDIEDIMSIYKNHISEQFKQSPEQYGIGKSQSLNLDIERIVNQFIEVKQYHQPDIADARQTIITELSQTPGVVGVIPLPEGTQGTQNFDIIAITLKSNNVSPDKIDKALKLLYSQIQTSAQKRDEVSQNILDVNNIELYTNGKDIEEKLIESQSDTELDLYQIFQLHRIKVAKRSTDFKYHQEYNPHNQAMSRYSQNWDNRNNIPTLTDSYCYSERGDLITTPFNKSLFQLSAQQVLGLPLA